MSTKSLSGSCLCGGITYEIYAPLSDVINCHCSMCRKAHGAAFRTRASIKSADFKFLSGEGLLTYYESSPGEWRSFCSICGSNLITKFSQFPDVYGFPLGTLDTDPEIRIERHVFTRYKASWYDITDELPQIEDLSEAELREAKNK